MSEVNSHGLVTHWFTGESIMSLPSHLNARQLWKHRLLLSKSNCQSHIHYKILFSAPERISVSASIALKCITFKFASKQRTATLSAQYKKMIPPGWRFSSPGSLHCWTLTVTHHVFPYSAFFSFRAQSGMLLNRWHFYISCIYNSIWGINTLFIISHCFSNLQAY